MLPTGSTAKGGRFKIPQSPLQLCRTPTKRRNAPWTTIFVNEQFPRKLAPTIDSYIGSDVYEFAVTPLFNHYLHSFSPIATQESHLFPGIFVNLSHHMLNASHNPPSPPPRRLPHLRRAPQQRPLHRHRRRPKRVQLRRNHRSMQLLQTPQHGQRAVGYLSRLRHGTYTPEIMSQSVLTMYR
jgi:hypothetical protein